MKIKSVIYVVTTVLITSASLPAMAAGGPAFPYGHPGEAKDVTRVITIKAGDMFFDPKAITVHVGDTVKFVVINEGKVAHEFSLGDKAEQTEHEKAMQAMQHMSMPGMTMKDRSGMQGMSMMGGDPNSITLAVGQTRSLIWTFTQAGTVEYGCHEPGHFAAGMVGTITIETTPHQ